MTAHDVLDSLAQRGATLTCDDTGALRFRAPVGVLTDADRVALRQNKDALIALLTSTPSPPTATTGKKEGATGTPAPARPATTRRPEQRRSAPKEQVSREKVPTQPCAVCGSRRWRLRETPASAGAWSWVCARCVDAAGQAPNAPQGQVNAAGAATSPHTASPELDGGWSDDAACAALRRLYDDLADAANAYSERWGRPWPAFEDDGPLARAIDLACDARDWQGLQEAIGACVGDYRTRLAADEATSTSAAATSPPEPAPHAPELAAQQILF